jgi:hypothetical protein
LKTEQNHGKSTDFFDYRIDLPDRAEARSVAPPHLEWAEARLVSTIAAATASSVMGSARRWPLDEETTGCHHVRWRCVFVEWTNQGFPWCKPYLWGKEMVKAMHLEFIQAAEAGESSRKTEQPAPRFKIFSSPTTAPCFRTSWPAHWRLSNQHIEDPAIFTLKFLHWISSSNLLVFERFSYFFGFVNIFHFAEFCLLWIFLVLIWLKILKWTLVFFRIFILLFQNIKFDIPVPVNPIGFTGFRTYTRIEILVLVLKPIAIGLTGYHENR